MADSSRTRSRPSNSRFAEGSKKLAQYQWIETTVISLKGEEKSRKQNQCYYGADGKVQKVPVAGQPRSRLPAEAGAEVAAG